MAAPLTWRNIEAPTFREAGALIQGAQQAFSGGLNQLNTLLTQRQEVAQAAIDRENEARVQGFLDSVQGFRSADALSEAIQAGQIDALRAALRPADQARVRGEAEKRLDFLRGAEKTAYDFRQQQLEREFAPKTALARQAILAGDKESFENILRSNPAIPHQDKLRAEFKAALQADQRFKWAGEQHESQLSTAESQRISAEAARKNADANLAMAQATRAEAAKRMGWAEADRADALAARQAQADKEELARTGNPYANGVFTLSDLPALKDIVFNKEGPFAKATQDSKLNMVARLEELATQGGFDTGEVDSVTKKKIIRPIAKDFIKGLVSTADDNSWFRDKGFVDNLNERLTRGMTQMAPVMEPDGKPDKDGVQKYKPVMVSRIIPGAVNFDELTGIMTRTPDSVELVPKQEPLMVRQALEADRFLKRLSDARAKAQEQKTKPR